MIKYFLFLVVALLSNITFAKDAVPIQAEVSGSLRGINWKVEEHLTIQWYDGCKIVRDPIFHGRVCDSPRFTVSDYTHVSRSFSNNAKVTITIDGYDISNNKNAVDHEALFTKLNEGETLLVQVTTERTKIYTTPLFNHHSAKVRDDKITVTTNHYVFEGFQPAYKEYLELEPLYLQHLHDEDAQTALIGFLVLSFGTFIFVIVILPAYRKAVAAASKGASGAKKAIQNASEAIEEDRKKRLHKRIEEEETIRHQVRESLKNKE